MAEVIGAWGSGKITVPDIANLFPVVVSMYPQEPSQRILRKAASHLRSLVEIASQRIAMPDCRKSASGGVATHATMRELIGVDFEEPRHSAEWGAVIWIGELSKKKR
jgi:hypothetical protein